MKRNLKMVKYQIKEMKLTYIYSLIKSFITTVKYKADSAI